MICAFDVTSVSPLKIADPFYGAVSAGSESYVS